MLDEEIKTNIGLITERVLDPSSMLVKVDPGRGKYLSASVIVRGRTASPTEVAQPMQKLRKSN